MHSVIGGCNVCAMKVGSMAFVHYLEVGSVCLSKVENASAGGLEFVLWWECLLLDEELIL